MPRRQIKVKKALAIVAGRSALIHQDLITNKAVTSPIKAINKKIPAPRHPQFVRWKFKILQSGEALNPETIAIIISTIKTGVKKIENLSNLLIL